jgi:uncharacterized protein YcbK (DUF882 family)
MWHSEHNRAQGAEGAGMEQHRRKFLKIGAQAMAGCLFPSFAFAALRHLDGSERVLHLYNTHTGETLSSCYYSTGKYQLKALQKIDYLLRDHYTEAIKPIDRNLLDLLYAVSRKVGGRPQFHIISGYRSPETNAMLCKKTAGVAPHSLHIQGKAVDIRLPAFETKSLRDICMSLKGGGVGYYRKSNFVHMDTGRIRFW